eukprot:GHVL01000199.1.p1 GENE.GHVL01000199.1~~GHVL01000199.1.p1  ORF type:complete len:126 (-),score=2.99 GHVL01000199.1:532-909(-)
MLITFMYRSLSVRIPVIFYDCMNSTNMHSFVVSASRLNMSFSRTLKSHGSKKGLIQCFINTLQNNILLTLISNMLVVVNCKKDSMEIGNVTSKWTSELCCYTALLPQTKEMHKDVNRDKCAEVTS